MTLRGGRPVDLHRAVLPSQKAALSSMIVASLAWTIWAAEVTLLASLFRQCNRFYHCRRLLEESDSVSKSLTVDLLLKM